MFQDPITILNAKATTGIGTAILVIDFDDVMLALHTSGNANLTTKFQVSYQKEMPDFAAAQSPTNQWDYVDVVDLEDRSAIDGDTGIALAGTDDNRNFEVNVSGARWFNAVVTARSAGAVTLTGTPRGGSR